MLYAITKGDGKRLTDEERRDLLKRAYLNEEAKQFLRDVLDEVNEDLEPTNSEDINHAYDAYTEATGKLFAYLAVVTGWVHPRAR
jgi:ribosome recycling factor